MLLTLKDYAEAGVLRRTIKSELQQVAPDLIEQAIGEMRVEAVIGDGKELGAVVKRKLEQKLAANPAVLLAAASPDKPAVELVDVAHMFTGTKSTVAYFTADHPTISGERVLGAAVGRGLVFMSTIPKGARRGGTFALENDLNDGRDGEKIVLGGADFFAAGSGGVAVLTLAGD